MVSLFMHFFNNYHIINTASIFFNQGVNELYSRNSNQDITIKSGYVLWKPSLEY